MSNYTFSILIILVLLLIIIKKDKIFKNDNFDDYVSNLSQNDDELKDFCGELKNLDNTDTNILLMKKYNDSIKERKNKEIRFLKNEIDRLYINRLNKEIENHTKYKLNNYNKTKKQMEAIDLAKRNIINDSNININIV